MKSVSDDVGLEAGDNHFVPVQSSLCCTPQPLYNTIVGVQTNFLVSYTTCVITRVNCIDI